MPTIADLLTSRWTQAADKRTAVTLWEDTVVAIDRTGPTISVEIGRHLRAPEYGRTMAVRGYLRIPDDATRAEDQRNGYQIVRYTWPNPTPPQPPLIDVPAVPAVANRREIEDDRSIDARFEKFDADNPHVYQALERMALDLFRAGQPHFGVKLLAEKLRHDAATTTTGDPFKLDNRFVSRYARRLIQKHPELATVIETRCLRS